MRRFHRRYLQSPHFGVTTWVYISVALALGVVVPHVNEWFYPELVSPMAKDSISTLLSAIASGMITLTGIVFSLLFVMLQFGSSAYSPRITRLFARAHIMNHSLGIFTGTFLYSLMALREVGIDRRQNVSALTVWMAILWLLASIAVLAYLLHLFTTLTITNVLAALGQAGRAAILRLYSPLPAGAPAGTNGGPRRPSGGIPGQSGRTVMYEGEPGYVIQYNTTALVSLARASDAVIHLPYAVGDALKDGEPIALIRGDARAISDEQIFASIILGRERAFHHDPKYALRLLVDTAIRALSPAVNDPTTAVQALDHIESLLRRLGNADLDIGEIADAEGVVRVVCRTPRWEDYLLLGLSEIMLYGEASMQVERRLEALLLFLRNSVPPFRAGVVERFYQQRRAMASAAFSNAGLRELANVPDREGIGSGDGVVAGHVRTH